jgi:FeS assembly SUF system protein
MSSEFDMPFGAFMPGGGTAVEEGFTASAGAPLPESTAPADMAEVVAALQTVHDPEIPVNIYELGLIYDVDIAEDGSVAVLMTLTAPACPVAGELPGEVAQAVADVEGVGEVLVTLTWEPAWTPEKMSEDAKLALGVY